MFPATLALIPQSPAAGGALATAAYVSVIVIAVAVVVVAALSAVLFLRMTQVLKELRRSAHQNFGPVSDRARSISDNVEFITQALRTDVEKLNASVRALSERLHQASDRMEDRIEEFNALMELVQGEAEDIFLDTASTVRGVREGARSIASAPRNRAGHGEPEGERAEEPVERSAPPASPEKAVPGGEDRGA